MLVDGLRRRPGTLVFVMVVMLLLAYNSRRIADNLDSHAIPISQVHLDIQPQYPQTGEHPKHLEIFSPSTSDKKFFKIKMGAQEATNANIIPSAIRNDTWVVVTVMQQTNVTNTIWFAQLVCDAQFTDEGVLGCLQEPMILPIPSTNSDKCTGDFGYWALNLGPHDGRVFYGPEHPYIIYGSNSQYNCFGMWMQDMRMLVDWGIPVWADEYFRLPTDLQRPGKPGPVEKNWFAFWDESDKMYIHHDSFPQRVFAAVAKDGTAGRDLGAHTKAHDKACFEKHLPKLPPKDKNNAFHQATNSLSITLCKRSDPNCHVSNENTFIMTIIQHKTYDGHAEYDPYVFLFQRTKPFKLYGINPKPLWIHGREVVSVDADGTNARTQMFYVTSMSWKSHEQKYHGYIDDVLFLGFGIEDDKAAAIDVVAGDLLQDLGWCGN